MDSGLGKEHSNRFILYMDKVIKLRFVFPICILFLISFLSLSIFSYTTSPFYFEKPSADSAIFQLIGKYWAHGLLPYVSLWDQKGPIIFFINEIGYILTGTATGVFIIEVVAFFVTLCILYRLLREEFTPLITCALLLLPAISLSANNLGGNGTEEYLLPLLAWSYWFLYKWLDGASFSCTKHPWKYAIVYGMVLSFSLLTRLTNALGICGAVAIVGIYLISQRQWKNLLANIVAFIGGFAILFVPFAVYFALKGSFGEMWYGTFLYNLDYAAESVSDIYSLGGIAKFIMHYWDTLFVIVVSFIIFILNPHRRLAAAVWFMASMMPAIWFVKSNGYSHYGIISLPLVCIAILELSKLKTSRTKGLHLKWSLLAIYTLGITLSCIHSYKLANTLYATNPDLIQTRLFMKSVPSTYKSSFVGYNVDPDYCLYEGIRPACRFFINRDFRASRSKSLKKMIYRSFEESKPQWILVKGRPNVIASVLQRKYRVFKRDSKLDLTLYEFCH